MSLSKSSSKELAHVSNRLVTRDEKQTHENEGTRMQSKFQEISKTLKPSGNYKNFAFLLFPRKVYSFIYNKWKVNKRAFYRTIFHIHGGF